MQPVGIPGFSFPAGQDSSREIHKRRLAELRAAEMGDAASAHEEKKQRLAEIARLEHLTQYRQLSKHAEFGWTV